MGHSCPHRARTKMKSLLVCLSVVAVAFAEEEAAAKPVLLPALGYPYAGLAHPYAYAHPTVQVAAPEITLPAPIQYKYVPYEVEIEVKSFQPELVKTGCVNSFGNPVPCFLPGEARKKRSADEETPAATVPLVAPHFYGGYGAYLYAHHLAAPYFAAPKVTIPDPIVKEIPVNTPVYKQVVEKVPIQPACQNGLGFAVPCL